MGLKEKESHRDELRTAVRQLSDRCLYSASKWAAEQLVGLGIEEDTSKFTPANPRFQRGNSSISHPNPRLLTNETPLTPIAGVSFVTTPIHEDDDKNVDADCYMISKSYFNCKEYRRSKGPKRIGALDVTCQLFKVYFKLGTVHLCRSVIRSIETARIFDFEEFPVRDKVTYMYYTGWLEVYNENFLADVVLALKRGDLRLLRCALQEHEDRFLRSGVYLVLEKLEFQVYQRLVKKIYIIQK